MSCTQPTAVCTAGHAWEDDYHPDCGSCMVAAHADPDVHDFDEECALCVLNHDAYDQGLQAALLLGVGRAVDLALSTFPRCTPEQVLAAVAYTIKAGAAGLTDKDWADAIVAGIKP